PLSGVASVIAVIQLTSAIVSICYEYRSSVKHAFSDVVRLTGEVESLGNVLKQLLPLVEQEHARATDRLQTTELLAEPLKKCLAELSELEAKLRSGMSGGVLKSIGQTLIWPLKERDITKILDRLERFKALLCLALTVDHTTLLLAIQDDNAGVKESMIVMTETLKSTSIETMDRLILSWLGPLDPTSIQDAAARKRQANTGQWFLSIEEFRIWRVASNSFLWIHGIRRPLIMEEVAEMIAVDLDGPGHFDSDLKLNDIHDILALCSSLITISTSVLFRSRVSQIYGPSPFLSLKGSNALRAEKGFVEVHQLNLAHYSVKEWLVSSHTSESLSLFSGFAEEANDIIARTCLVYIYYVTNFPVMANLCIEDFPFVNYAIDYCFFHMRQCGFKDYSQQLQQLNLRLLKIDLTQRTNMSYLFGQRWESYVVLEEARPCSPLYWACSYGVCKLVELLLAHGADANESGGPYVNALHAAIAKNHPAVVGLLVRNGADVNLCGIDVGKEQLAYLGDNFSSQLSPLQWATVLRSEMVIPELLLKAGAERADLVQLLLERGANPNLSGGTYDTALHAATVRKDAATLEMDTRVVELLLSYGAERNARDRHGWTAFQCAQVHESFKACHLLRPCIVSEGEACHVVQRPPQDMIFTNREFTLSEKGVFVVADDLDPDRLDAGVQLRGNHCVPSAWDSFYFEMTVLDGGELSEVSIGLCDDCFGSLGLAGWLYGSWGYHGDDGNLFSGFSHTSDDYGPTYGTDDVVGCGFDKRTSKVYFTKNGKHLGTIDADLRRRLFPLIATSEPHAKIKVNLGNMEFVYQSQGVEVPKNLLPLPG
ncbi:hypothetical protein MMC18_008970, partial [Xylographa bjoerkii]|nr:hypothetical protein [Xylographa bjoerkii]